MEPQFDAGIDSPAGTSPTWIAVGVLTGLAALAGAVLWLLWLLVAAIADVFTAAGHAAGDAGHTALDWLSAGSITRTITDPVHAYIDSHAAGLPASADQVWWGWLITGAVLLVAASCGSWGARIGWTLYGATTAAMVWAASPVETRELAVAVTAGVWSLLAVPAFARTRVTSRATVVVGRPTDADSAESEVVR